MLCESLSLRALVAGLIKSDFMDILFQFLFFHTFQHLLYFGIFV